jgi:hypothetical protein
MNKASTENDQQFSRNRLLKQQLWESPTFAIVLLLASLKSLLYYRSS